MQIHLRKTFFVSALVIVVCGIFFAASFAHAASATLFFKTPSTPIGVGDQFSVALMIDSGGTSVNTIAGELVFSDPLLSIEQVTTGSSIVSSWIQSPVVSGNAVTFSGIMPGGYVSVTDPVTNAHLPATVLTLVFRAKIAGAATLAFSDSHVYLNDGLGTEAGLVAEPYTITIAKQGSGLTSTVKDSTPPEEFTPVVSSSPDLWNGAYALFFGTTDKGSGMDHYEVSEGFGDWIRTDSPYKLSDQTLRSRIRVKAVDSAGNYRIEDIASALSFNNSLILIPIALIALCMLLLWIFYKRKMKGLRDIT